MRYVATVSLSLIGLIFAFAIFGCGGGKATLPSVAKEESPMKAEVKTLEKVKSTVKEEVLLPEPEIVFGQIITVSESPMQLTSHESDNGLGYYHPTGESIIFQSNRDGRWQIYELKLLGGYAPEYANTERRLIESEFNDENPVWTVDGNGILFVSDRDSDPLRGDEWQRDIYLYNTVDESITNLTKHLADDWYPIPLDEESFLFLSERDVGIELPVYARQNSLYKGFYDGTKPVRIAGTEINPNAPLQLGDTTVIVGNSEGRLISYTLTQGALNADLSLVLTTSDLYCGTTSFNPVKEWLAFSARLDDEPLYQLYILDRKGKPAVGQTLPTSRDVILQRIDTGGLEIRYPQFSNDGSSILYTAEVDGHFQLFKLMIAP